GPTGTLWARAGNDVDRALLLRELLGRAHVRARLVHGEAYGVEIRNHGSKFRYVGPARTTDQGAAPIARVPKAEYHTVDIGVATTTKRTAPAATQRITLRTADVVGHDVRLFYRRRGRRVVAVIESGRRQLETKPDARTALRQELVFLVGGPGATPLERRRELFTREFTAPRSQTAAENNYPSFFSPTNRYTIAVTAGWVPTVVANREDRIGRRRRPRSDGRSHRIAYRF